MNYTIYNNYAPLLFEYLNIWKFDIWLKSSVVPLKTGCVGTVPIIQI